MVMGSIDGSTVLLGVLGHHISYTLSPKIHNLSAASLGKNAVYVPLCVAPENLAGVLESFWHLGALGFNVTKPHKEKAASLVSGHKLKAVNTIYRGADGWLAASTDAKGLFSAVLRMGRAIESFDSVVILGSGGVATCLFEHISLSGKAFPEIVVLRRSGAKDALLRGLLPRQQKVHFAEMTPENLQHYASKGASENTLILQATSAPTYGKLLEDFVPSIKDFKGSFVDLCYGVTSKLLTACQKRGLPSQDGIAMLIEQARLSQQYFWGESASYELIEKTLRADINR